MSFGDFSTLGAVSPPFPGVGIPGKAGLLARGSHRSHPRQPGPSRAGSTQASQFACGESLWRRVAMARSALLQQRALTGHPVASPQTFVSRGCVYCQKDD